MLTHTKGVILTMRKEEASKGTSMIGTEMPEMLNLFFITN